MRQGVPGMIFPGTSYILRKKRNCEGTKQLQTGFI